MSKFTNIYVSTKIKLANNSNVVVIHKARKEGTKREFFTPEFNGKKITTTMFARLSCAKSFSKSFLTKLNNQ